MRTLESGETWVGTPDEHTDTRLWTLRLAIERGLDRIHDETLAKFRILAKSTGQRTRVDRMKVK